MSEHRKSESILILMLTPLTVLIKNIDDDHDTDSWLYGLEGSASVGSGRAKPVKLPSLRS